MLSNTKSWSISNLAQPESCCNLIKFLVCPLRLTELSIFAFIEKGEAPYLSVNVRLHGQSTFDSFSNYLLLISIGSSNSFRVGQSPYYSIKVVPSPKPGLRRVGERRQWRRWRRQRPVDPHWRRGGGRRRPAAPHGLLLSHLFLSIE